MGRPSGRDLIALGGAVGLWDELEEAQRLFPHADVGAVNDAGSEYSGHLTLFATLHPEKFGDWQRIRERRGLNTDYTAISHKLVAGAWVDLRKSQVFSGDSGLYLCQVAAIHFGYERIIACGMPLNEDPHYFDSAAWQDARRYRRGWREASQQPELRDKIRSMSGWTRGLLGSPTDWLAVPAS